MALTHILTDGTETGATAADKINAGFTQNDLNNTNITAMDTHEARITQNEADITAMDTHESRITQNETDLVRLNAIQDNKLEPTGFDLYQPLTKGIMELCANATSQILYRIDENDNAIKLIGQTTFGDGTPLTDRTFVQYPCPGQASFSFWNRGNKFTKTTTQRYTFSNNSIKHIVVYDENGDIKTADSTEEAITHDTLAAIITGHPLSEKKVVFGNERHGKEMSGATHLYNHEVLGAQIGSRGFGIEGLTNNGTSFTRISSGTLHDEDIRRAIDDVTSTTFIYRNGVGGDWDLSATANNLLGLKDGDGKICYNGYDNGTDNWSLTPIGNGFMIIHLLQVAKGQRVMVVMQKVCTAYPTLLNR